MPVEAAIPEEEEAEHAGDALVPPEVLVQDNVPPEVLVQINHLLNEIVSQMADLESQVASLREEFREFRESRTSDSAIPWVEN